MILCERVSFPLFCFAFISLELNDLYGLFHKRLTPQLCVITGASFQPQKPLLKNQRDFSVEHAVCKTAFFWGGGHFCIYSLKHLLFRNRVLLCNADCHPTHVSPASPSQVHYHSWLLQSFYVLVLFGKMKLIIDGQQQQQQQQFFIPV